MKYTISIDIDAPEIGAAYSLGGMLCSIARLNKTTHARNLRVTQAKSDNNQTEKRLSPQGRAKAERLWATDKIRYSIEPWENYVLEHPEPGDLV